MAYGNIIIVKLLGEGDAMDELNVYSGKLNYKNMCFDFVYDNQELRLIPPLDKKEEVKHWRMQELSQGWYTMDAPLTMEVPYLEGTINETGQSIVFIMREGDTIGSYNSVLRVQVLAVILFSTNKKTISRIAFTGPEINAIHSVGQAFSLVYEKEKSEKGIVSVQTTEYEKNYDR